MWTCSVSVGPAFSTKSFSRGDTITEYTGDLALNEEEIALCDESQYLAALSNHSSIDAARLNSQVGRFINAPRGQPGLRTNCQMIKVPNSNKIRIQATKRISPDDELFVRYGPGYWSTHNAAQRKKASAQANSAKAELGPEPTTIKQAKASSEWPQWSKACEEEMQSLRDYKVFVAIDRSEVPKGTPIMSAKWVFKRKLDGEGNITRHKARLVARGFTQQFGINYDETFANVMQLRSVRLLLALGNQLDYNIHVMDVQTAYLNAELDHEIYMKLPEGLDIPEANKILRLFRALYGLKQSGRLWNKTLVALLIKLGYTPLNDIDPCVMVRKSKTGRLLIIGLYVDDMPYLWHDEDTKEMQADKAKLMKVLQIKDLGSITDFLGMHIEYNRSKGELKMHQSGYAQQVCETFGFDPKLARKESTPEYTGDPSTTTKVQPGAVTLENYRGVVGSLGYLALATRPDLSHAVSMLARDQSAPTAESIIKAKKALRYLCTTLDLGLTYRRTKKSEAPEMYSDSDWAGSSSDGKSTTGYVLVFCGAAVLWNSQKQATVSLSSAEAEYIAATSSGMDICWVRNMFNGLGFPLKEPTKLYVDNSTAIRMTTDEGNLSRRRHINVKHHKIREWCSEGTILTVKVDTREQQADIFTKSLPREQFKKIRSVILGSEPKSSLSDY